MTRHDLTKTDRDLINLAVVLDLTDAVEVACDMTNAAGDVDDVIGHIFDAVAAFQHDSDKSAARRQWFAAYDARCAAQRAN